MNNNEITQLADELYDKLTKNRDQLAKFLSEDKDYITYKVLNRVFSEIRKRYNYTKGNIITDLLLGSIGPEHNKQKAIYEFPTYELLVIIFSIVLYFNISDIEEIMSGQGLFASLLFNYCIENKDNTVNLKGTDGMCQSETSGYNFYYPIEKKNILEYLIEKETDNRDDNKAKLFIVSWPDLEVKKNFFSEFIKKIKPELFVLIGQKDMYKNYFDIFEQNGYRYITFTPYQICFKDTFSSNSDNSLNFDIFHSSTTLFINKNIKTNLQEIKGEICNIANSFDSSTIFRSDEYEITSKYLLKYYSEQKKIPELILTNISNSNMTKIINCLYNMSLNDEPTQLPNYLTSFDEFEFWHQLYNMNKFPESIISYEKFVEFKNLYEKINSNDFNLTEMKNKNVFPNWVTNKIDAIKCLILDYSKEDKKWKESSVHMNRIYTRTYN